MDSSHNIMKDEGGGSSNAFRKSERSKKISEKMAYVDTFYQKEELLKKAIQEHLDFLEKDDVFELPDLEENDNAQSDTDYYYHDEDEHQMDLIKEKKRILRSQKKSNNEIKNFTSLLHNTNNFPNEKINYFAVASRPPKINAPRKFCSVCGQESKYTCVRCGSRFCCRRCNTIHKDTRCLRFMM